VSAVLPPFGPVGLDTRTGPRDPPTTVHAGARPAAVPMVSDFETLFRTHYWSITRSLAVAFGSTEDAADAVQDAFVRAYGRWDRISRYDDPAAWIRHVAINRLRDGFRRTTRARRALARLGAMAEREAEPPLADDNGALDVEVLARRLAALSRQQRLALTLFYVEDLSVAEVARSMGISPGAVKFHLHQGREALRRRLAPMR
jgi:RNA polymerase sigma-70 factor (ECF subfamily)